MPAAEPFRFQTTSYLVRIGNLECMSLVELRKGIEDSSDASIFYHRFQSLGRHHYITEGFSNDFAQWVLASCNRPVMAEQLASIDIRDYVSIAELRTDLSRVLTDFCQANPREALQSAFEPFYFSETIEEIVPLGNEARTLQEFRDSIGALSHASLQFHFITSRLRLHLCTNDFSFWLVKELGEKELARKIDLIDVYTNTLDGARDKILGLIGAELR